MTVEHRKTPGDGVDSAPDGAADAVDTEALTEMLVSAWDPKSLPSHVHQRLLDLALDDPDTPITQEERCQAEQLRDALSATGEPPGAALARALGLAARSAEIDPTDAVRAAEKRAGLSKPGTGTVIYVTFGVTALAAAAAAVLALFLDPVERPPVALRNTEPPGLLGSRSTAPLFGDKFVVGQTTQRVDRIALVRDKDLRSNRFALWGVR
jgi:hypothetical protein